MTFFVSKIVHHGVIFHFESSLKSMVKNREQTPIFLLYTSGMLFLKSFKSTNTMVNAGEVKNKDVSFLDRTPSC